MSTYHLLVHATVKLTAGQPKKPEDDTCPVNLLLLSEEYNNSLTVGSLAKVNEVTQTLLLAAGTKTHKVLHQGSHSLLLRIHHQPDWLLHS